MSQTNGPMRAGLIVLAVLYVMLPTSAGAAQRPDDNARVSTSTLHTPDLAGRMLQDHEVTTRRTQSNGTEEVIVDSYGPSTQEGRLGLRRRVSRVTTESADRTETVEDTLESSPALPGEPLRLVQRSLTTTRKTGPESYVSEREVFQVDVNGRLALVSRHTERLTRK